MEVQKVAANGKVALGIAFGNVTEFVGATADVRCKIATLAGTVQVTISTGWLESFADGVYYQDYDITGLALAAGRYAVKIYGVNNGAKKLADSGISEYFILDIVSYDYVDQIQEIHAVVHGRSDRTYKSNVSAAGGTVVLMDAAGAALKTWPVTLVSGYLVRGVPV